MRKGRNGRGRARPARDRFLERNARHPLEFSCDAEGWVYDSQTESQVRGAHSPDDYSARIWPFLFGFLLSEAFAQTALEWEDREARRDEHGPDAEKDDWRPVRVELLDDAKFQLVLRSSTREIAAVFSQKWNDIKVDWVGLRKEDVVPSILNTDPTRNPRLAARNAIRIAISFFGRIDPYGRSYLESEAVKRREGLRSA